MNTCQTKLEGWEEIAGGTMAFHFEKPAGFSFKPGQAMDVVIDDTRTGDPQAVRHTFSIVSAPFENELAIATRMRDSAFKNALKSLPIGAAVGLEGPFGALTLHSDRTRTAVFIAGGIGITPFMSILRQAIHERLPQRMRLLYANRRPEDAAFLDELRQRERQNANFRMIATMTATDRSSQSWEGETSSIDRSLVKRIAGGIQSPVYYLAGSPTMVAAMRELLNSLGADDDDIRSEDFYGY